MGVLEKVGFSWEDMLSDFSGRIHLHGFVESAGEVALSGFKYEFFNCFRI